MVLSIIEEEIEPPDPCETCGGLEFRWNYIGVARCMKCGPPIATLDWLKGRLTIKSNRVARAWYNELLKASGLKCNPKTGRHER